jgi:hypothetical protein
VVAVFEGAVSFVAFVWPSSPRAATDERTFNARNARKQRINVRVIVGKLRERRFRTST